MSGIFDNGQTIDGPVSDTGLRFGLDVEGPIRC